MLYFKLIFINKMGKGGEEVLCPDQPAEIKANYTIGAKKLFMTELYFVCIKI
jgi:hypothetical protein